MSKYAWYTRRVKDEMEKIVRKYLEKKGGIPKGQFEAIIAVQLDDRGVVTKYSIIEPSGNPDFDAALKETLSAAVMQDPPPPEMPRVIKLKILSQG
jgi:TonB family protein